MTKALKSKQYIALYAFWVSILLTLVCRSASAQALIDREKVTGVELLVADESDNRIEAAFGHALLRLVGTGGSDDQDLVLGFEAEIGDASRFRVLTGGALGEFNTVLRIMPMTDIALLFTATENRGFSRLPLRLTPTQIGRLVSAVNSLLSGDLPTPKYTFFNFNCGRALIWLFANAGVAIWPQPASPSGLEHAFRVSLLAPWGVTATQSGAGVMRKVVPGLRGTLTSRDGVIELSERQLSLLTREESFVLANSSYRLGAETKAALVQKLKGFRADVLDIYRFRRLPVCAYQSTGVVDDCLKRFWNTLLAAERRALARDFAERRSIHRPILRATKAPRELRVLDSENRNEELIELFDAKTEG